MISVIIPYKDAAQWIGRCCDSLVNQAGDFEFIFINDGSKDDGPEIVAGYEDPRFILIDNENKAGVSGARNTGLKHATGDYITFLDADDELLPDAYKTLTAVIAADDQANIHQLNHIRVKANGDEKIAASTRRGEYDITNRPRHWPAVWNKIYRREFLKGVKFNEKLTAFEDWAFNLDCLAKDNYIHHASLKVFVLLRHFDNPESLSKTKTSADLFRFVKVVEDNLKKCKSPEVRLAYCEILSGLWASSSFRKVFGE